MKEKRLKKVKKNPNKSQELKEPKNPTKNLQKSKRR
jgi:hypothetical protein